MRAMNQRAAKLGLKNTHYANPIGLDDPANYSTARDLVRLTLRLRAFDFFRRTVARERVTLQTGQPPAHAREPQHARAAAGGHRRQDRPHAAGRLRADRLRPQERDHADLGRARRAERRARARPTRASCSPGRSSATSACARSGRARCSRTAPIKYRRGAELELVAGDTARRFVIRRGQHLRRCGLRVPTDVAGPISRGQKLGEVDVCRGKKKLATLPVVAVGRRARGKPRRCAPRIASRAPGP